MVCASDITGPTSRLSQGCEIAPPSPGFAEPHPTSSSPGFAEHHPTLSSPEFAKRILRGSKNTNLDSRLPPSPRLRRTGRGNDNEKTLREFAPFAVQIKASSSRGLTAGSIMKKIPACAGMTALKLGGPKNSLCPLLISVPSVVHNASVILSGLSGVALAKTEGPKVRSRGISRRPANSSLSLRMTARHGAAPPPPKSQGNKLSNSNFHFTSNGYRHFSRLKTPRSRPFSSLFSLKLYIGTS